MNYRYLIASKGVLGLRTNAQSVKWSYGWMAPPESQEAYDACALRLTLNVADIEALNGGQGDVLRETTGKYHYFLGKAGEDLLYYDRRFMFGSRLQIEARGLTTDEPTIVVNRNYFRYVSHRFMNLHSIGYILTDVAALLLLRRGFAPIHCSAFRVGERTVVVCAPPNTGKTLTTMMACLERDADFIAEDIAFTDGVRVYSVPWTTTFRYYARVERGLWTRLVNGVTRYVPLLELLPLTKSKSLDRYLPIERICDSAEVTDLVVLERGQPGILREPDDVLIRKVVNLNRFEFNYHKAPLVVAYDFFNPGLNIDGAVESERELLRTLVQRAKYRFVVRAPNATQYADMILDELR